MNFYKLKIMRIKNLFGLFLVLCISLLAFTACSSDNDDEVEQTYEYQITYSQFAGSLSNMNVVTNAFVKAFGVNSTPLTLTGTLKECDRLAKEYAIKAAAEIGTESNFSAKVDFRNVSTDQTIYSFEITKSDNSASTEDIAKDEIVGIWQVTHVEGWTYRNTICDKLIDFDENEEESESNNFTKVNKDLTEEDDETMRLILLKNGSCVGLVRDYETDGYTVGFYGDYGVSDGKIKLYYMDKGSIKRKANLSVSSFSSDKMVLVQNLQYIGTMQRTTTWKKISDSDNVETGIVGLWQISKTIDKTEGEGGTVIKEEEITENNQNVYRFLFLADGSLFALSKQKNWYADGFDFDAYGIYEISGNSVTATLNNSEPTSAEFKCENGKLTLSSPVEDESGKIHYMTSIYTKIK